MADAVLLRKKARDGSAAGHWLRDFQTGDTPARRAALADRNDGTYDLIERTFVEYEQAKNIEYGAELAQATTDRTAHEANYASAKTKVLNALAVAATLTAAEKAALQREIFDK